MNSREAAAGSPATGVMLAVLAAATAPFLVTGLLRYISDSWLPVAVVVGIVAAALTLWRPYGRHAAAGLVVGTALWAVALIWLFAQLPD